MVVLVVGMFALSELIMLQSEEQSIAQEGIADVKYSDTFKGAWEAFRSWKIVLRSSLIGIVVGCVPGLGGVVAQYVTYWSAKTFAKDKSMFGKGDPRGVIASESANNSRDCAGMLPTLFLGIPGSGEMAILLGIFLIFGITPGPGMAVEHMGLVWIIILCLMGGNILATVFSLAFAPYFSRITTIPIVLVTAFTVPLCLVSLYTVDNDIWSFALAGLFGVFGILLKRAGYSLAPVIIGYVLATLAENAFHTTMQSSYYNPMVFFQSSTAIALVIAIFLGVLIPAVLAIRRHLRRSQTRVVKAGNDPIKEESAEGISPIESLFVTAVLFLIALFAAFTSKKYNLREAGLWPLIIAVGMIVSSFIVLISDIRRFIFLRGAVGSRFVAALRNVSREWIKIFRPLGWTIFYIVTATFTGIHVADLVCVFFLLYFLGKMSVRFSLVGSIAVHACIYLFFTVLFKIMLWPGLIPTIIPNLIGGGTLI